MSGSLTTVMPPVGVPPRRPEPMRQPPGGLDRPGRPPAPPRREPWPPPEPPRTGPRRVGPPPPPRDEPELKSESEWVDEPAAASDAPRRKRPVLFALLAILLVVGVGTGVVFAVPGLRDSLGLAGDDAAAVVPPAAPIAFTPGLRGPDPQAAAPTPEGVRAALEGPAGNPGLGALTGVVLDPATGTVLWESGPTEPRTPASNTKLLTAAAALLTLDHTEQLTTKVVEGDQPGSVVIVGGGDPTLSSLDPGVDSVYPGAAHLSDLVDQVKASGVQVTSVTVDLGRYTGGGTASGWGPDDIDNGYITPIVPAMLDGGRSNPQEADPPRASNPARDLVEEFAERVGAEVPASAAGTAPQGARVLGEVHSAPLTELVDNMLRMSDNVLGEIVAHEVAKATGGEATFEGGSKATLDVLRQNGFDVSGVELSDGSGLSTQNLVPAALLGQILSVAAGPDGDDPRTVKLRPLLGGLPVAGGTGTLADRFGEAGATDGKGWVRAKTGTLSGVNSLAGLVLDVDGRPLVFAFMTTGTESAAARPALDEIVAPLRQCGCR